MSIAAAVTVVILPLACVAAAAALMRLFDVKDTTAEQAQFEAEKLLVQVNREVTVRRRVRAGAPDNMALVAVPHFTSLSTIRIRFPSA